ncbi:hypothetical protein [Nesterenkonia ebinurensis]|uniref:hypothetical protein n=1 Tax=Nesterenkonia ebinurensis TaxID=2608252 RepID=UPI00123CE89D|nr:hypothetical protein [Nesterenkonia ebinurensis]
MERHRQTAASLANRGLILLDRGYDRPWRARLTPLGRYWLEHRHYPPQGTVLEPLIETEPEADPADGGLSDGEFMNRRRVLKSDWAAHGFALSWLEVTDQWTLHAVYQPSRNELSDTEALDDYRTWEQEDPDKVAESALVWVRYEAAREHAQEVAAQEAARREPGIKPPHRKQKDRNLSARALARPEPDIGKLAHLVTQMAAQMARESAEDPDATAEERERARGSAALLGSLEFHSVPETLRPRRKRKPRPVMPDPPRSVPAEIDAKLKEAWSCHRAGTHLAAVLVTRSTVTDILTDAGESARSDDLITPLIRLAEQKRLGGGVAESAAALRCLAIVPAHPPVTEDESAVLLNTVVRIVADLYPGGPPG